MKRFEEQFKKQAQSVHLRAAERRDLKERLVSYMEYHPMPKTSKQAQGSTVAPVSAEQPTWLRLPHIPYLRSLMGSTLAIVILAVPLMAERAMPGDILYSVKVGFNEEVRSSISRSPYQSIEWETERINRRLAEAQVLAREGRLTEEHEERVADAVRTHSESARASIQRLREEDEDEAAMAEIALSALFDVHMAVLAANEREEDADDVDDILAAAATTTATTTEERRSRIVEAIESSRGSVSSARDGEQPTYESLLRRIEVESSLAYDLLSNVVDVADDDALTSITRRLDDVDRKVQKGIAAHDDGDTIEARVTLTEALTSTRKVITFMSNIEVRNSIDIDTLVPIEYTADELREQLHFKRERLQVRYEYVDSVLEQYADEATLERAETALATIPEQFASSTAAIEAEEFGEAGTILADIESVLDDIVRLADIPDRLPSDELGTTTPTTTEETATTSSETGTTTDDNTATSSDAETEPSETATSSGERATSTDISDPETEEQ